MKFSNEDFRRSTKCPVCTQNSACVEVAMKDGQVGVRDSKLTESPVLMFGDEEWKAFVTHAKTGQFDV